MLCERHDVDGLAKGKEKKKKKKSKPKKPKKSRKKKKKKKAATFFVSRKAFLFLRKSLFISQGESLAPFVFYFLFNTDI